MKTRYCLLALVIVLNTGCSKFIITPVEKPQGHFYLDAKVPISSVNRVALLELDNQSSERELPELLAQSLADEIGKKHLFSIRSIERSDPAWNTLNLEDIETYSYEDLDLIRQDLNIDAIIFGTIERYGSFPRKMMAMKIKMVDVRTGQLIWAVEQVWDSTDKQVELRMKRYYKKELRTGYEPLNWEVLNTSPRAFNKFVSYEVADTLPDLS